MIRDRRQGGRDGDGRHVDPALGILEGEGSQQAVPPHHGAPETPPEIGVPARVPSAGGVGAERTYYDRPVVKEPVWICAVPV